MSGTSKKVNSQSKSSAPTNNPKNGMSREEMISVAAYYRAEQRGFDGGDPVADWLDAEAEINSALSNSR